MPIDPNDGTAATDPVLTEVDGIDTDGRSWANDSYACDVGRAPMLPPKHRIRAALEDPNRGVAVVRRQSDNLVVGVAIFNKNTGRIIWIAAKPGPNTGNILLRLCHRVHQRTGILPWGQVNNPVVRDVFFTAEPNMIVGEGNIITWPGP